MSCDWTNEDKEKRTRENNCDKWIITLRGKHKDAKWFTFIVRQHLQLFWMLLKTFHFSFLLGDDNACHLLSHENCVSFVCQKIYRMEINVDLLLASIKKYVKKMNILCQIYAFHDDACAFLEKQRKKILWRLQLYYTNSKWNIDGAALARCND